MVPASINWRWVLLAERRAYALQSYLLFTFQKLAVSLDLLLMLPCPYGSRLDFATQTSRLYGWVSVHVWKQKPA